MRRLLSAFGASVVFISTAFPLFAAKDAKKEEPLRPGKEELLNSAGVKFRALKDAEPRPLPIASIVSVLKNNKSGKIEAELYSASELWRIDESLAQWESKKARIVIARVKSMPPAEGNLSKADFAKAMEKAKAPESKKDRADWALAFAAAQDVDGEPVPVKAYSLGMEIEEIKLKGAPGKTLFFVVNAKDERQDFAFLYEMKDKKDPEKHERKIIEQSVASASCFQEREGAGDPKELQTAFKATKGRSANYARSRAVVLNSLKNLKDWWFQETEDFIIASNVSRRSSISEIQNALEADRKVYETLFPPLKPVEAVSVVRVFNKREEYVDYVGKEGEKTLGLWAPSKKELAVSPPPADSVKSAAKAREKMLGVLAHESFHQYLFYACGGNSAAPWFNEGTARIFNNLRVKGSAFETDLDVEVLENLRDSMKTQSANLEKLVALDYDGFYEKNSMGDNYNCACALMYFLYRGTHLVKGAKPYAEIPVRYYKALCESGSQEKAQKAAFAGVDMKALEKDWREFWTAKSLYNRSKNYEMKPLFKEEKAK